MAKKKGGNPLQRALAQADDIIAANNQLERLSRPQRQVNLQKGRVNGMVTHKDGSTEYTYSNAPVGMVTNKDGSTKMMYPKNEAPLFRDRRKG